jgi:hypothetical protein
MDFLFMEFFLLKKHGEKLEDYFKTTRQRAIIGLVTLYIGIKDFKHHKNCKH